MQLFSKEESVSRHFCWFPGPQKEPACPRSLLLVLQTTPVLWRGCAPAHIPLPWHRGLKQGEMQPPSPSGTFLGAVPQAAAEVDAISPAPTDGDPGTGHWGYCRGLEQGARRSVSRQSPACDEPAPPFSLSNAWEAQASPGDRAVALGMQDCWAWGDPRGHGGLWVSAGSLNPAASCRRACMLPVHF